MTKLSPAAQAVLDAYGDFESANVDAIAAALRAAADQVLPITDDPEFFAGNCCERNVKAEREDTRADLLSIAAELEGSSND